MYRFYQAQANQKGSYEKWTPVKEEDVEHVRQTAAYHMTVLSVSATDAEDWDEETYRGDLWFDLDAGSLEDSIRDLHALMETLVSVGVNNLEYLDYFASGSKGFHVRVPAELFGGGKPTKRLPLIYRQVALNLAAKAGIQDLDLKPYSGKRGGMLRIENKQRPDGRYKVPLTLEEVKTITPELYWQYVSAPRNVARIPLPKGFPVPAILTQMYDDAKKLASEITNTRKLQPVADELLKEFGDDKHPLCIQWLMEGEGKVKQEVHWNQKAVQMSAYLAHVEMSEHYKEYLVEELTKNHQSKRYPSQAARKRNVYELTEYAANHSIRFACRAICNLLTADPCQDCVVRRQRGLPQGRTYLLEETAQGYMRRGSKVPYCVLPVTFKLTAVHRDVEEACKPDSRAIDAVELEVVEDGERIGKLELPADVFASTSQFRGCLQRWSRSWKGTEAELSDLGEMIKRPWEDPNTDIEVIMKTKNLGLQKHYSPEFKRDVWYYVEPGWSLNDMEVSDFLQYKGKEGPAQYVRRIKDVEPVKAKDPEEELFKETVRLLCEANFPHVVAHILGWNIAATVRPRMMEINPEFPLLNIWGGSGHGKTRSAILFSILAGADFSEGAIQAPNITNHAARMAVAINTSIPKLIDEMNPASMDRHRWNSVSSVLKATYQNGTAELGTVKRDRNGLSSPDIDQIKSVSPVIWMCVHQLHGNAAGAEEIKTRTLEVNVTQDAHAIYGQNFRKLETPKHKAMLLRIYALLVRQNIFVSDEDFAEFYELSFEEMPSWLISRFRTNYGTPVLGLNWLARAFRSVGYTEQADQLLNLKQLYLAWVQENRAVIEQRNDRQEVDNVIDSFNIMAQQDDNSQFKLKQGFHYVVMGDTLYLRLNVVMSKYNLYKGAIRQVPEITNEKQFLAQCRPQKYFKHYGPIPAATDGSLWLGLFMSEMQKKGIDVSGFKRL